MNSSDAVTGSINIGNPVDFIIRQLAESLIDLTGFPLRIVHLLLPQDDRTSGAPTSTAEELLAWKPSIQLKEGLVRTINYFESLLREPGSTKLEADTN